MNPPAASVTETHGDITQRGDNARHIDGERVSLQRQLAEKVNERERILTMFRRGRASVDEVDKQLDAADQEADQLRRLLAALDSQTDLADAVRLARVNRTALLANLQARVAAMEGNDDVAGRRGIIVEMVSGITVTTVGTGRRAVATIEVSFVEGLGAGPVVLSRG